MLHSVDIVRLDGCTAFPMQVLLQHSVSNEVTKVCHRACTGYKQFTIKISDHFLYFVLGRASLLRGRRIDASTGQSLQKTPNLRDTPQDGTVRTTLNCAACVTYMHSMRLRCQRSKVALTPTRRRMNKAVMRARQRRAQR
jgi:hypothetical protein